jgi:uncharacterized protein (TIGR00288 family)
MLMTEFRNIALLIDGENVTSKHLKAILESLASYGTVSVRRIYADWTGGGMKSWKEMLQENSLIPVQQFSFTQGKNSTDSAMIIDAMDLVHDPLFDCFALVSSDSDFTRLAQRIREKGRYVIGYGEEKTPPSFRASCNDFVVLSVDKAKTKARTDSVSEVERLLLQGIDLNSDDDGWCDVAALAGYLKKIKPDFAPVDLGVKKFSDFFKDKANEYELRKQNPNGPGPMFVRRKDKRKP